MATFSSKQYSWADLTIAFGGRIIEGITEVEYSEKSEKAFLYGRGNKPHHITRGKTDYSGKIVLWQSELEAITRDAPKKDALSIEFDIIITYASTDGGQIITDILKGCQFTDLKKNLKQDDKNMLIDLPIMFVDIKRQQ